MKPVKIKVTYSGSMMVRMCYVSYWDVVAGRYVFVGCAEHDHNLNHIIRRAHSHYLSWRTNKRGTQWYRHQEAERAKDCVRQWISIRLLNHRDFVKRKKAEYYYDRLFS